MKKIQKKWLLLPIIAVLFFIFYEFKILNINYLMGVDNCKDLYSCILQTKLDVFEFDDITNSDFGFIISFSLKKTKTQNYYYDYYEDSGVMEIKEILSKINVCLNDNNLNEKICCVFRLTPGDGMCIYNYDYREENAEIIYNDFAFFKSIYVENFSILKEFEKPMVIQVFADKIDYIDFVNTWDELKYLEINSLDISEEQVNKIYELLPNCDLNINPM